MGLDNDEITPWSLFLAPLTTLRNDGEYTTYSGAVNQGHCHRITPKRKDWNQTWGVTIPLAEELTCITHEVNPKNHCRPGQLARWLIFAINTRSYTLIRHIQSIKQFFFSLFPFTFVSLFLINALLMIA